MDDDSLSDDDDQLDLSENTKRIVSIQLGQVDIDCWFHSPYIHAEEGSNEKDRTIAKLFICEFCLRYFLNQKNYRQHTNECHRRYPPGRQIYEDLNGLTIYEIDGSTSELYCQCLCLLSKLFLERKTIYFDVSPFLFYVLVETDKRMKNVQHLIGYFSKEKASDELNNLACLMVLPHRQREGFGRFLIALSYEITKLEKKTGSPEKPLSALGQMTYKSYWRSTLLTKLDEYRRLQKHVTISQLSLDTGICLDDVIRTLIDLQLAYTGQSSMEMNSKQYDHRHRRRQKSLTESDQIDDNNNNQAFVILTIDEDRLQTLLVQLNQNSNLLSKTPQHLFYPKYLRFLPRR